MFFSLFMAALVGITILNVTPIGREILNTWRYNVQKSDDATRYETRRNVENTCRGMQAAYKTDVLTWKQYKGESGERRAWADSAKLRANSTAAAYNEYVLKNSFVFEGNVPGDIASTLSYLE